MDDSSNSATGNVDELKPAIADALRSEERVAACHTDAVAASLGGAAAPLILFVLSLAKDPTLETLPQDRALVARVQEKLSGALRGRPPVRVRVCEDLPLPEQARILTRQNGVYYARSWSMRNDEIIVRGFHEHAEALTADYHSGAARLDESIGHWRGNAVIEGAVRYDALMYRFLEVMGVADELATILGFTSRIGGAGFKRDMIDKLDRAKIIDHSVADKMHLLTRLRDSLAHGDKRSRPAGVPQTIADSRGALGLFAQRVIEALTTGMPARSPVAFGDL